MKSQLLKVSKLRKEFLENYGSTTFFCLVFSPERSRLTISNDNFHWLLLIGFFFHSTRISLPVILWAISRE
jgi:hypothetical protein